MYRSDPSDYFASGLGLATVERLFLDGLLPRWLRQFKYQLLMVYRLQNESGELPHLSSKQIEKYCEVLIRGFDDQCKAAAGFVKASEVIETALKTTVDSREPPERTKVFTVSLSTQAKRGSGEAGTVAKLSGTVKWFSTVKWFGFITADNGKEVYFRSTSIAGESYGYLEKGQRVKFAVIETPRGEEAADVEASN